MVHTKTMEGGLHQQPVWKYLHLYCEGGRKHEVADGGATWTLHFLCFQSAFCHLFHSPSQKALQIQAIWQSRWTYGFVTTRTQPVSVMEGIWLFSALGIATTKKLQNYQVSPDDRCSIDASRDTNHEILTALPPRVKKF